jgi:glycosyltransferase involved in cell wall biosynthesis/tetratricopeptide (TPR) repeat protein
MYTLIAFATQWGSKHGGINSFNADFLTNFGAAYHHSAQIVCVVTDHTAEAAEEAAKSHVKLLPLPYIPRDRSFDSSIGELSVDLLRKHGITFEPETTIWLGHDLITGGAAIAAAQLAGGRSAVIHHMSYDDYESYAEDSESAQKKTDQQTAILKQADRVLAIGPLLRDAASDRLKGSKPIHMLAPGLPEINAKEAPNRFVAFLSGRLTADAARIKQGLLGVAAFASAESLAHQEDGPEPLKRQPKLLLRGVDFENQISEESLDAAPDPEAELKKFVGQYTDGVIDLHTLPYTENRQQLYSELSAASVALMPSWHEGFGLVAWEAIAAGVPLIIGENTGVYRLLDEEYSGAQTGYVYHLDVRGKRELPYFQPNDLKLTANALKSVATDPAKARKRASTLRNQLLEKFTWSNCCGDAAKAFGWDLQKGIVPDRTSEIVHGIAEQASAQATLILEDVGPLKIPRGQWRPGAGMADSQLLRAEEELLPFDMRRQPEVDKLTEWATDPNRHLTVRLVTGEGGQGKTRLAIHLCQQFRAGGWHAGFLDSGLEPNRVPLLWRHLREHNRATLIVVDYAETRQDAFLAVLKAALQTPLEKPSRILLLARNGGEWWDNLPSTDSSCEGLLNGPATTGPFELPALYTQEQERQQAFSNALSAFAEILQVDNPGTIPELVGDQFQRPLFVQMAALLALYGERPTTIQGLTKALLNHERRYWIGLLGSFNWIEPGRRAEQLLALATLVGGFPTAKIAEAYWRAARVDVVTPAEFNSLFRNLAALYPGAEGLQALRPDLIGEALVAQALLRPDGDVLLDASLSSSASQAVRRNALTVLARLSNERADVREVLVAGLSRQLGNCAGELVTVSTESVSRLPELAELAFEGLSASMKSQVAGSLRHSLPDRSVHLAGLNCLIFGHLAENARKQSEKKPNNLDRLFDYGVALERYGIRLFRGDRFKAAVEISATALSIQRKLFSRNRNRFEANYCRCLDLYAVCLARVGRVEEALVYDREALEIYQRRQHEAGFQTGNLDYAVFLTNYGAHLMWAGDYEEASAVTESALAIYRKPMERNADETRYLLTLSNYADDLSIFGQDKRALEYSEEVLSIRKQLAQKNPDRFEPDYARSLTNCASYLVNLGHYDEALVCVRIAYEIRKRLAKHQPQRFGDEFLITVSFIKLVTWLCGSHEQPGEESPELLLAAIHADEQLLVRFYQAFVDACIDINAGQRLTRFRFVVSTWTSLSQQYRHNAKAYYLCAAGWCSEFASLPDTEWQPLWRDYLKMRNGNIPISMLEIARRLQFEFPENNVESIMPQRAHRIDPGSAGGGIESGGDGDDQGE